MSRIGKQPISIPEGTDVTLSDGVVSVKGPKGTLERHFKPDIKINVDGNRIVLEPSNSSDFVRALWGTYASHISNMIDGVNKPFEKKLIVEGVGFKVEVLGEKLVMRLGFSHLVELEIPRDLSVSTDKNVITISGINKEHVGHFSAKIRSKKKPEPYKGKGIRYEDEVIRRKQGKKAIGSE